MTTFTQYLIFMAEDAQSNVQKLQMEISTIDAQIAQRTQPLVRRKDMLTRQLMMAQKQAQAEAKKSGSQTDAQSPQEPQMTSNQTTTPGGSGQGTPGG